MMATIVIVMIGGALLALVAVGHLVDPPDDPWMMDNSHTLTHHYRAGLGEPHDQPLAERSLAKSIKRDSDISRIRALHTDREAWRPHTIERFANQ